MAAVTANQGVQANQMSLVVSGSLADQIETFRSGPNLLVSDQQDGNEKEDAEIVATAEAMQEEGSLALRATGAISDDGIIDPRDTRSVLGICLSVVNGKKVEGAEGYGVYRL